MVPWVHSSARISHTERSVACRCFALCHRNVPLMRIYVTADMDGWNRDTIHRCTMTDEGLNAQLNGIWLSQQQCLTVPTHLQHRHSLHRWSRWVLFSYMAPNVPQLAAGGERGPAEVIGRRLVPEGCGLPEPALGSEVYLTAKIANLIVYIRTTYWVSRNFQYDNVAEWLRRWIANPLFSERESSNLFTVVCHFDLF